MVATRNCIFCNRSIGRKKSKEHIFPMWLQKYLGIKEQFLHHTIYTTDGNIEKTRRYGFDDHVSGLVCSDCNSGWLSRLEGESKNTLMPLLDGSEKGNIDRAKCEIIARWFYKTVLVLHSIAIQEKFIPAEHYTDLYNDKIPTGVYIAIAPIERKGYEDLYWIQNGGWPGNSEKISIHTIREYFQKSYKITMRAGSLAWRVTYLQQENIPSINFFEYRSDCVRYVHPCGAKGVTWHSINVLDDLKELDSSLSYSEKRTYN